MISIIITTKKEPQTLPRAIKTVLDDISNSSELVISKEYEVLVVGPDKETKEIVAQFPEVKFIQDKGIGKPAAINLAFRQAQGDILILTDGDVYLKKCAVAQILRHFDNEKIGAVSGHPVSNNPRENIFGYWSHFLTDAADWTRRRKSKKGEYLVCSGYLYAFRNIIKEIPAETLVEDSIISQMIYQNGYQLTYEPEAIVNVKFPTTFEDWLKQKIRATGGYVQPITNYQLPITKTRMRGFLEEVSGGIKLFFTYPKNPKEFWWTILLYLARLYLWFLIFIRIKILKKYSWERVETTK